MIRFVCTCGNRLEVPQDQAGNSIQCPTCGLLTDVPTLSELGQFTDDGIYKLDANAKPAGDDPDRMIELEIIYSKDKRDAEGNEIDLRTVPGARRIRAVDDPNDDETGELDFADEPDVTTRPKYDPETGELIRPLEIRKDPDKDIDPSTIPVAKAALSYAGGDVAKPVSPLGAAVELLMPVNMLVMTVVVCVHIFAAMMATVALQVLFFIVPAWLFLQGLILSHYGNVIDDIGRNEADDLPRPLRDLSWYDDIWSPFVAMFGGLMITFVVPIFALTRYGQQAGLAGGGVVVLALVGFVVGTLIGPAVLLTTNTSGSALNLRPDRLLHVVRICGWHYIGVTLLWAVTWPLFMLGWFGVTATMVDTFALTLHRFGPPGGWFLSGPALLIGTFLMHWFCWYVGLLYRAHHHQFPWVLQRHVRDPNRKRVNHADKLRTRRPVSGHLAIPTAPPPPPPSSSQAR